MKNRNSLWRASAPRRFAGLARCRAGVTMIEYALIAAISAMVIVTGLSLFGYGFGAKTGEIAKALDGGQASAVSGNAATGGASGAASSVPAPAPGTAGQTSNNGDEPVVTTKLASPD